MTYVRSYWDIHETFYYQALSTFHLLHIEEISPFIVHVTNILSQVVLSLPTRRFKLFHSKIGQSFVAWKIRYLSFEIIGLKVLRKGRTGKLLRQFVPEGLNKEQQTG